MHFRSSSKELHTLLLAMPLASAISLGCLYDAQAQSAAYVFSNFGYGIIPEQTLDLELDEQIQGLGLQSLQLESSEDDTQSVGAGLGFFLPNSGVRIEAGLEHYADIEMSAHDQNGATYNGGFNTTAANLSAFYDVEFTPNFRPYIGAGFGYAYNVSQGFAAADVLSQSEPDRQIASGITSGDFSWNAGFGAALSLTEKTSLDIGYRFVDLGEVTVGDRFEGSALNSSGSEISTGGALDLEPTRLQAHQVRVGLRHALSRDVNQGQYLGQDDGLRSTYGLGYGRYGLKWHTKGPGGSPDVLVETDFRDLESIAFKGNWQLSYRDYLLDLDTSYAWIWDGTYEQYVYDGEDRTDAISRIKGQSSDDYIYDVSLGFGRSFDSDTSRGKQGLAIKPLFGVSATEQKLRLTKGNILTGTGEGSQPALNSNYNARWLSGWIGGEAEFIASDYRVMLRGELHKAYYDASGRWSRDLDLVQPYSFEHDSNRANGVVVGMRIDKDLSNTMRMFAGADYESWAAYEGASTGIDPTSTNPQLNAELDQVTYSGVRITAGLVFGL